MRGIVDSQRAVPLPPLVAKQGDAKRSNQIVLAGDNLEQDRATAWRYRPLIWEEQSGAFSAKYSSAKVRGRDISILLVQYAIIIYPQKHVCFLSIFSTKVQVFA